MSTTIALPSVRVHLPHVDNMDYPVHIKFPTSNVRGEPQPLPPNAPNHHCSSGVMTVDHPFVRGYIERVEEVLCKQQADHALNAANAAWHLSGPDMAQSWWTTHQAKFLGEDVIRALWAETGDLRRLEIAWSAALKHVDDMTLAYSTETPLLSKSIFVHAALSVIKSPDRLAHWAFWSAQCEEMTFQLVDDFIATYPDLVAGPSDVVPWGDRSSVMRTLKRLQGPYMPRTRQTGLVITVPQPGQRAVVRKSIRKRAAGHADEGPATKRRKLGSGTARSRKEGQSTSASVKKGRSATASPGSYSVTDLQANAPTGSNKENKNKRAKTSAPRQKTLTAPVRSSDRIRQQQAKDTGV
ncbi:hypothetical protein C8Q74DRAFT_754412 [Fomes fomentarius]|nr:hypothetical protein C8Q74DRAFT_754412 [Fomes fomentarius]